MRRALTEKLVVYRRPIVCSERDVSAMGTLDVAKERLARDLFDALEENYCSERGWINGSFTLSLFGFWDLSIWLADLTDEIKVAPYRNNIIERSNKRFIRAKQSRYAWYMFRRLCIIKLFKTRRVKRTVEPNNIHLHEKISILMFCKVIRKEIGNNTQ